MIRFAQALAGVILATLVAGILGGAVGAGVGWLAPTFVMRILPIAFANPPEAFRPVELGLGLGVVSGLFLGVGTGLVLVVVLLIREAWFEHKGMGAQVEVKKREDELV